MTIIAQFWSSDEDAILRRNIELFDGGIAAMLRAGGFSRTVAAVAHRRKILGLRKARIARKRGVVLTEMQRQAALENLRRANAGREGWPTLLGNHYERDAAFVRMLLRSAIDRGLLRDRRAA